jgi:hypothetical protein
MEKQGVTRVDVYRRRRRAQERYRFLLCEKAVPGKDALAAAREIVTELTRQFPDYEFVLVVRRDEQE